jgi:hypothetical protein
MGIVAFRQNSEKAVSTSPFFRWVPLVGFELIVSLHVIFTW